MTDAPHRLTNSGTGAVGVQLAANPFKNGLSGGYDFRTAFDACEQQALTIVSWDFVSGRSPESPNSFQISERKVRQW
jgi:hypothetical protein